MGATRSATADSGSRAGDILGRLRTGGAPRPVVDPGLAGGLRDWLEDALAGVVGPLDADGGAVRLHKGTLNQVLVCEAHLVAARHAPSVVTAELVRGSLVDAVFRQWVTTGSVADPWEDAVAALAVSGDHAEVVDFARSLDPARRRALEREVGAHAARIAADWSVPAPSWMARTQERVDVALCGGRVVLSGVLDLVLGTPGNDRASVCLVELKSGPRRVEHRGDLHFYTLLETLRSGSPPFKMATYYSASGELDDEPVDENALLSALRRTLEGATRLCRLAGGAEPVRTPNPLCAWCADLPRCEPGRRRLEDAADDPVAARPPGSPS